MLVNHNSIIGVNSITANGDQLYFYKEDGTDVIFNISNINVLNTSGVSTFAGLESTGDLVIGGNVSVGGTLTYEDVTNVDSVGIITAQSGIHVTGGSVGLGTDNPSQLLHLQSDSAHQILLKRGGQFPSECKFSNSGNLLTISNNKNGIHFDVGSSSLATAMYIEDGGKVGIGTDNPSELLHLQSGWTKQILKSTNLNTASYLLFDTQNVTTADFLLGRIAGKWNGSDVAYIQFEAGADTTNKDDGVITFLTSSASSTPTERLRIGTAGQIGLGGANYGNAGEVLTSNGASSAPSWQSSSGVWLTSGTSAYYTAGNVGIGTDDPEYDLDIGGLAYSLSPKTAGVGTARIASMLGIGVTNFTRTGATPVEKHGGVLSLGGDATTGDNPMIVFDSYPASTSFVNVVIGSDETGRRLNGNTGCVYIGGHAGRLNTGGHNIAIGSQALTGGGGSFVYAIGYRAGTEGTGQNNVCIGKNAGSSYNGTAGNNIFLGHNAGSIGGGDYDNNILIGSGSGNADFGPAKSANDQLAIGFKSSSVSPSKYWIVGDENQRIGIGTNLPSAKIHINNDPNSILGRFDSNNKRCIDLVANDSTGDAEIRGFKNTGSGAHTQTILLDASGNSYLMGGNVALGHNNAVKLLHLRSDATSAGHTLLRLENLQNNTGGPTECHIDMWLDNSNSNNTGASIGVVEDSNDGYADLVFKTTAATNSDTLHERVRFDREGGVLIAGQPMHVCYAVTVASRTVTGSNSTTLLPSSSYDPMNDFNETTGVYTVPIAGRYLLFYGTQGKTSSNSNAGSIYYNINNTGISGQCLYYGDAYSGNSKTTILNLSQNDTIKFQIHGNNGVGYTINGAHFGIYLLG